MAYEKRRPFNKKGRNNFGGKKFGGGNGGERRRGPKKENIHPSKFIKKASLTAQEEYKAENTFDCFQVAPLLKKNINKKGFKMPSPIQDQSIPHGLEGRDVIGIANTGTGKTIAFAIPALNKLIENPNSNLLIMAPTRELAQQILEELKSLTIGGKLFWALLIGGSSMPTQLRDLRRRPRIVIGTPGRIQDHIKRKSLKLDNFDIAVLDEVDRMLDMGFVNDMRIILAKLSEKKQSFFFSATMNTKVNNLIKEFSNDPITVSVKTGNTSDNVEQNVVKYKNPDEKFEKLHAILEENSKNKVLIFEETKRGVDKLNKELSKRDLKADSIHGDKSQGQRKRVLENFKSNRLNILVATDVAARGIDVKGITHVINYSTPQSYDDYVHRIGRVGRAGEIGYALTFINHRSF